MGDEYHPVTRPGHRLPHAWLEGAEGRVSTLDLVGRGGFTLFVASDESEWRRVGDEAAAQSGVPLRVVLVGEGGRSEEHTSELQSLMRISYAVFCLKKKRHEINHDYIKTTRQCPSI